MDGFGERGNRVHVHDFFNTGNIAAASTEHGREPQRTGATALAKRGWRCIPTVTAAALEHLFCWYYCDGSGGLGVEMGRCLNYWQWDACYNCSPLLDRQLGRCCGRGKGCGVSSFGGAAIFGLMRLRPWWFGLWLVAHYSANSARWNHQTPNQKIQSHFLMSAQCDCI